MIVNSRNKEHRLIESKYDASSAVVLETKKKKTFEDVCSGRVLCKEPIFQSVVSERECDVIERFECAN